MNERKKHGWAWWFAAGLFAVPVLYFLSSGPVRTLTFRQYQTPWGELVLRRPWYHTVYRPLIRAVEQPWGKPIELYWELFPFREDRP